MEIIVKCTRSVWSLMSNRIGVSTIDDYCFAVFSGIIKMFYIEFILIIPFKLSMFIPHPVSWSMPEAK